MKPAPFKVGDRVTYPGPTFKEEGHDWTRIGDVGVVVKIAQGMRDPGDGYGDYDSAAIIEYPSGSTRAVTSDSVKRPDGSRYEKVIA